MLWDLAYSMKSERIISLIDQRILNYLQQRDLLAKGIAVIIR